MVSAVRTMSSAVAVTVLPSTCVIAPAVSIVSFAAPISARTRPPSESRTETSPATTSGAVPTVPILLFAWSSVTSASELSSVSVDASTAPLVWVAPPLSVRVSATILASSPFCVRAPPMVTLSVATSASASTITPPSVPPLCVTVPVISMVGGSGSPGVSSMIAPSPRMAPPSWTRLPSIVPTTSEEFSPDTETSPAIVAAVISPSVCSTAVVAVMLPAETVPPSTSSVAALISSPEISPFFSVRVFSEASMAPPAAVAASLGAFVSLPTVVSDASVTFSPAVSARMEIEFAPASSVTLPRFALTAWETVMAPPAVTEMSPPAVLRPETVPTVPTSRAKSLSSSVLSMSMTPSAAVASMAMVLTFVFWPSNDPTTSPRASESTVPDPETSFAESLTDAAAIAASFLM